jgi:adenine-specific DNA-methyltransferase
VNTRARQLRKEATQAEQILWKLLRSRQLEGYKFRRQNQFGNYILDFYCHAARLAIEVDGGGHFSSHSREYDAERTAFLAARRSGPAVH